MQTGLVPRISGRHTCERITAATAFMDHKSEFGYSHLCTTTSQEETLLGKVAFEKLAATYGVKVEAYHADNGRFTELGFCESSAKADQTITFCGVSAHHQTSIMERYIQDITKSGRTLLLHAKQCWRDVIGTIIWLFALKAAKDCQSHLKLDKNDHAPINKFSCTFSNIDIKS